MTTIKTSDKINVVNIKEKLSLFTSYWDPKIVGELNDDKVQVVKLKGPFNWHHHETEEELFLVIKGERLIILSSQCNSRFPSITVYA